MLIFQICLLAFTLGICNAQCWCVQQGKLVQCSWNNDFDYKLCGSKDSGFQTCCSIDDTCESDSICSFSHAQANGSGFYIAGCTDESHSDPICNKHCTDLFFPDIVYNRTSSLWACCESNGGRNDCGNPGIETFYAAAPQDLEEISSSSTRSSSTSSSSQSTTTSSSTATQSSSTVIQSSSTVTQSSSTPTYYSTTITQSLVLLPTTCSTNSTCPSHLSAGGKAGIGIGGTVAALALFAGIYFVLTHQRRSKRSETATHYPNQPWPEKAHPVELNGADAIYEVHGRTVADAIHENHGRTMAELPASKYVPR